MAARAHPVRRAVAIAIAAVLGIAGALGGWQAARSAALHRAIPTAPDLAGWPGELANRIRDAERQAHGIWRARQGLAELAKLYHANGFFAAAATAERGLRKLAPDEPRWAYYLADLHENTGQPEDAIRLLEATVLLAPDYTPARLRLAEALFKCGRPAEAASHYLERLRLLPNDPYAELGLARNELQAGDRAAAQTRLETVLRQAPAFAPAWNLLAEMHAADGDDERAAELRWRGHAAGRFREPDDPWLEELAGWCFDPYRLEVLGATRLQTGRTNEALPFFEKALRLAPDDGQAHDALAGAYLQAGRLEDARRVAEAGLVAAPDQASLYSRLSEILEKLGRAPEAIAALRRGLARLPRSAALHNDLGVALEATGRRSEAVAEYRAAIDLNPRLSEAEANLGLSLLALGQILEGRSVLERALTLAPNHVGALLALGELELKEGNLDRATQRARQAVALRPDLGATKSLFALCCQRQGAAAARSGRVEEARRQFLAGLAVDPSNGELHGNLGVLAAQAGDFEGAIRFFERFAALAPREAKAHLYLGQALLKAGRAPEARTALERGLAVARQENDAGMAQRLAALLTQAPP